MILLDFLTHQSDITESSGYSLKGSFTLDLIASKVWLLQELEKIQRNFTSVYILGSWYGNLSILLAKSNIKYDHIVNVDIDRNSVKIGELLISKGNVEWWPKGSKTNGKYMSWKSIADHIEIYGKDIKR